VDVLLHVTWADLMLCASGHEMAWHWQTMLTNAVNLLGIEYQRHASSISLA
jgi:hypothetical protein